MDDFPIRYFASKHIVYRLGNVLVGETNARIVPDAFIVTADSVVADELYLRLSDVEAAEHESDVEKDFVVVDKQADFTLPEVFAKA